MASRQALPPDLPLPTESEIAELQRDTLEQERNAIVRDVDPARHFSFLRSKLVMDADDQELVMSERTRKQRCEAFLDILSKRGSSGFWAFQESLAADKVQVHVLKGINKKFEELLQRLRERKAVAEQSYSPAAPPPYSVLPPENTLHTPVYQESADRSTDRPMADPSPFSTQSINTSQPCTEDHGEDRTVVSSQGERVESLPMNQKC